MTPKEKAEDLVAIYWNAKVETPHVRESIMSKELAKQCALIAVDGLIKESKLHDKTIYQHGRTFYWQEVKQEIEKL